MQKLTDQILEKVIKPRPQDSFKGTFGKVLLVGGNRQFGGAIIMAATAAVYSGAGLVTVATHLKNATPLHANLPEAMVIDFNDQDELADMCASVNTIVVGPGLGEEAESLAVLKNVLAHAHDGQVVVIDGSAITLMAKEKIPLPAGHVIFTPHQMEWQRLSGIRIADQTVEANQEAVKKLGAAVVVKKHHSEIYLNDQVYQLPIGSAAQAVGGMGDTLAGMVGGFCAQFRHNWQDAFMAAVYAHSAVADQIAQDQYIVLPHQISLALPAFMKKIASSSTDAPIGFIH